MFQEMSGVFQLYYLKDDQEFNIIGKCRSISNPRVSWLIRQSPFRWVYVWVFPDISIFGYISGYTKVVEQMRKI